MSIFEVLKADHKKIGTLLRKLSQTVELQPTKREVLFEQLKKELETHTWAEERAVYAPLTSKMPLRDLAVLAREEHGLVDHLLTELSYLSFSDPLWTAKATLLSQLVEVHVAKEEKFFFREMRSYCSKTELAQMGTQMKALKKKRAAVIFPRDIGSRYTEMRPG